ncbi:MAG: ribonuclease Z [Vallitaleaceae bacterium]|jgi:ribonuclease Z|nr:ribonuclease Z [Vallitaleaceae bacterium]
MLDVCLLGTGGMMPLPYRWLTALMLRYNGSNILIDCGEGTQITLKKQGWSFKSIDVICFTHYHGDHISGLPGMLLTMGNSDRTEPITMIGPKGLERVVTGLRVIAPELPFEIKFIELTETTQTFDMCGLQIEAYKVKHNVLCYGYSIVVSRLGLFDVNKAKSQDIPVKLWSHLQKGEVTVDGDITYTPDMVMGPARKGIKLAYCTDTRPTQLITDSVREADLFICEGMDGEDEDQPPAIENKHMTMKEAAQLAKEARVTELWLTHYSPAVTYPSEYLKNLVKVFPKTIMGTDRMTTTLKFED